MHYNLPPWSISILPDCKNTVYNTARVRKKAFDKYSLSLSVLNFIGHGCHLLSEQMRATFKKIFVIY
jgi:hypothetical protein